jgi:hypothetical protein
MNIDLQRYWGERELYFVGELCSKIIKSMNQDGSVLLFSKEQRSARLSGLYYLLDQLSQYHNWDKSKIILKTPNYLEKHDQYTIEFFFEDLFKYASFSSEIVRPGTETRRWSHEKTYGMFLGRANVTRIHAVHKHKNFEFHDQGLVSWHHNLKEQIDQLILAEYLMCTNQTYNEMTSIAPFSDIGPVLTPPITDWRAGKVDWASVYEKIGIELVFETSESSDTLSLSEKIYRPMLFKRPFMLIGGRHAIKNFKEIYIPTVYRQLDPGLDVCFFDNVISNAYDDDEGIYRVDHVFDILRELILTDKISTIIDDCRDGLETNYRLAQTVLNNRYSTKDRRSTIFDFESWKKPSF